MQIAHNKLLPLVVVVLLVVAGALAMLGGDDAAVPAGAPMDEVPLPPTEPGADADTPQETLNTVVGGFRRMEKELAALRDENERLREQNRRADDMEARLRADLERNVQRSEARLRQERAQAQVQAALDADTASVPETATDGARRPGLADTGAANAPQPRLVLPPGYHLAAGADGQQGVVRTAAPAVAPPKAGKPEAPPDVPYFTIPENATLTGATAMTAVVGRVPVDGKVTDPMQFKVLLGPDNLAANGHYLPPNLAGIVASGIAVGDMTLSCSEGFIQSMTFVFADGSIQTVSERKGGGGSVEMGSAGTSNRLGYISDAYGNPCVAGRFVTNAPAYLTDIVGLKTLSLAAEAAAAAQTTTTTSALTGSSSTAVTGDTGRYVLGRAISGGTDEVTQWILRRMDNSFDAVVTGAGEQIVVHIEKQIPIDKKGDARRLDYGRADLAANTSRGDTYHGLH
jgi:hypothetical protein